MFSTSKRRENDMAEEEVLLRFEDAEGDNYQIKRLAAGGVILECAELGRWLPIGINTAVARALLPILAEFAGVEWPKPVFLSDCEGVWECWYSHEPSKKWRAELRCFSDGLMRYVRDGSDEAIPVSLLSSEIVGVRVGDLPKPAPANPPRAEPTAATLHEQTGERVDKLEQCVESLAVAVKRLCDSVEVLIASLGCHANSAEIYRHNARSPNDAAKCLLREAQQPTG
jgi:hypothetical protein